PIGRIRPPNSPLPPLRPDSAGWGEFLPTKTQEFKEVTLMRNVFIRIGILLLAIAPIGCSGSDLAASQVAQQAPKPPEDLQRKMIEHRKAKLSSRGVARGPSRPPSPGRIP